MEETKLCPFCGEVILSVAKKCLHCGKWLEKKCPACSEWIQIDAKKCRYCGEWLSDYEKWKYEKETGINTTPQTTPSSEKKNNPTENDISCLLSLETLGIICLYTWYYDIAIWKSVIAFFTLAYLLYVRCIRILVCVFICILWGVFLYEILESTIGAIAAFAVAVAIHSPQFSKTKVDI